MHFLLIQKYVNIMQICELNFHLISPTCKLPSYRSQAINNYLSYNPGQIVWNKGLAGADLGMVPDMDLDMVYCRC